jgi:DeoR/GlpR family transcriptional regulator of sugar metabolism
MKKEKHKIGKIASDAVCDGDTIFIDASTTAEYMAEYLTEKKDLTVITNNLAIVTRLSEYNIKVICLGGKVLEPPYMLCGIETVENAMKYKADKAFFSTWAISKEGKIASNTQDYI